MGDVLIFGRTAAFNSGAAVCRACHHEWTAISRSEAIELECPMCNTMNGHFKWPFSANEGELTYSCECGCEDFFIVKNKPYSKTQIKCRSCGKESIDYE